MSQSNNTGKIAGALLIGAAVGAALGIIFAPDKGSETRKKILTGGEDLTDAMKEKFQSFLEEVKKDMELVKNKANAVIGNGVTKAEKIEVK